MCRDSLLSPANAIKTSVKAGRQSGAMLTSASRSHPRCGSASSSEDLSTPEREKNKTSRVTMRGGQGVKLLSSSVLAGAKRKHISNKKGDSFQFNSVVRTTRTMPQMISSTSKEFTFQCGNVPLFTSYTGLSLAPKENSMFSQTCLLFLLSTLQLY